jgi:hypothetical protein
VLLCLSFLSISLLFLLKKLKLEVFFCFQNDGLFQRFYDMVFTSPFDVCRSV